MDGAIRFTQRDALAAVLITAVNIVAGLIIGVLQHGLDLATAAETYTILTVGEGLVTAIPALLVSMAGGLITTRAAAESHLGEEVAAQLLAQPRPLAVAAGVLTLLALIPGLPKLSFLTVAAILAAAAYAVRDAEKPTADEPKRKRLPAPTARRRSSAVDPLGVEVGYALVGLVDEKQGGTLLTRVRAIRRQIATETGVVVPPVRIADNLQLGPRGYSILVKGVEVARGELYAERLLAINPGSASRPIEGVQTQEPAFGLPAIWIAQRAARCARTAAGYTVVDPTTALSTHLSETIRTFLPDLLSRQQVKEMVDRGGAVVAEAGRRPRAEAGVARRDSAGAATAAARARAGARSGHDPRGDRRCRGGHQGPDAITEAVRASIGRAICRPYQNEKGELPVIGVPPSLEEQLLASLVRTDQGAVLALDPQQAQTIAIENCPRARTGNGTARALVFTSASAAPVAAVRAGAAAPRCAVAHEVPAHVPIVPVATLD